MIVVKFGGTSLGNATRFLEVSTTLDDMMGKRPVVVVSAIGGVTNLLLRACEEAVHGRSLYDELLSIHHKAIVGVGLPLEPFEPLFESLRSSLEAIALTGNASPLQIDGVLSHGEMLSARILALLLTSRGIPATDWHAGSAGMVTTAEFGWARPLPKAPTMAREWYNSLDGSVPVVTGFLGKTEDGATTTLGRGGSDLSAAWFAAALGAEELQIWTDVSGVMSADPRLVSDARSIPELSFDEASEMAFRGAKVLHPDTLIPVREAGIPVRVLNSFSIGDSGTLIVEETRQAGVKCCTSQRDLLVWVFLEEFGTPRNDQMAHVLSVFSRHGLVIILMSAYESGFAAVTSFSPQYPRALSKLAERARVTVSTGKAIISLVGEGISFKAEYASSALATLERLKATPSLLASSATGRSISFIIDDRMLPPAVNALHGALCPPPLSSEA